MFKNKKGLTLIEAIVAIGILLTMIAAVVGIIIQGLRTYIFADEQADAINYARKGMDIMIKEIREASPAENGAYPIDTADDQNLIFYSDIDADELIERVHYYLDGTNLIKGVVEPSGFPPTYSGTEITTTISQYVRNDEQPIFYYNNSDYPTDTENNPLSTPANVNEIRLVRIYLKINIDPSKAPLDYVLISNSQIRNLKDNL